MNEDSRSARGCSPWIRLSPALLGFLLLGLGCLPLAAQDAAASQQTVLPMPKDADPGWEAVTIKPTDPDDTVSHINIQGRHVMVEGEPLESMLRFAYSAQRGQIVGAPEWMKTERWDVSGVPNVPGLPNLPQFQSMMRKLLAERFGLTLHHEQREMPVFALTVAKGGAKLVKSTRNPSFGPGSGGSAANGIEDHRYTNTSMSDLALMLMIYVDRPIVDRTGMQERYDFQLRWTKDEAAATGIDSPPGLFTAIQEQLGLKLQPAKAPADVLVIDKVQRPSAN